MQYKTLTEPTSSSEEHLNTSVTSLLNPKSQSCLATLESPTRPLVNSTPLKETLSRPSVTLPAPLHGKRAARKSTPAVKPNIMLPKPRATSMVLPTEWAGTKTQLSEQSLVTSRNRWRVMSGTIWERPNRKPTVPSNFAL